MVKVGINGAYASTTRAPRIDARRPSPPWIEPRASTPIVGEQTSRCPRLTIDRLRLHLPVNLPGFGRIGRLAFRLAYDHPEFEFVHINEFPGAGESSAYLAKYDSVHGQWPKDCAFVDGNIVVDGKAMMAFPPRERAAPRLKSTCPPTPEKNFRPSESAQT